MKNLEQKPSRILRRHQVERRTGLSRSTIYARMANNTFPRAVNLGGARAVGWLEAEIESWLQDRLNERTNDL